MNVLGFHHLAIQVKDLESVARFYREVVGLSEQARHVRPDGSLRSIWMAVPEQGFIALEQAPAEPEGHEFFHPRLGMHLVALRIRREDRPALIAHLEAKKVAVAHQTRWTVYVRDPEGNRVAFSHHPEDPTP